LKPYCDKGAIVRWVSTVEAILVFPTESIAKLAFSLEKNSLLKIISLQETDDVEAEKFFAVSTEIYNGLKPERDCRVANRMIGAALGITMPKSRPMPVKVNCPKKEDAWDD
jgi:hypothetical protein